MADLGNPQRQCGRWGELTAQWAVSWQAAVANGPPGPYITGMSLPGSGDAAL
jgi:hypothetical protein